MLSRDDPRFHSKVRHESFSNETLLKMYLQRKFGKLVL